MAKGNAAAVGIDPRIAEIEAEQLEATQHLRREGFIDFDHVDVGKREPGALQCPRDRERRADPHYPWRHADHCAGKNASPRPDAGRLAGRAATDNQGGSAIIDARGIARRHHATEQGFERCEAFHRCIGAGMLVFADDARRLLATGRDFDWQDLVGEEAGITGRRVFRLRCCRKAIGCGTVDADLGGHVIGGLRHAVIAVTRHQVGIRKACADRGVEDLEVAAPCGLRFADHERCAAHALDAARDKQAALAAACRPRTIEQRCKTAAAKAVDRLPRYRLR